MSHNTNSDSKVNNIFTSRINISAQRTQFPIESALRISVAKQVSEILKRESLLLRSLQCRVEIVTRFDAFSHSFEGLIIEAEKMFAVTEIVSFLSYFSYQGL
mgnify:CR=1 FL=1